MTRDERKRLSQIAAFAAHTSAAADYANFKEAKARG